jgi:hypothetical protein
VEKGPVNHETEKVTRYENRLTLDQISKPFPIFIAPRLDGSMAMFLEVFSNIMSNRLKYFALQLLFCRNEAPEKKGDEFSYILYGIL